MTSAWGQRLVEHQFVASDRNWMRRSAALARGEGEEHGERRHWTIWSPEWPAATMAAAAGPAMFNITGSRKF